MHDHEALTSEERLLRLAEAATLSTFGQSTLRRHIAAGDLPAVKIGRRVRIRLADLKRWLASVSRPATPAAA